MRRLTLAVGLAVVLAATVDPAVSAQPIVEQPVVEEYCALPQAEVPETTTPVPTSTSTVPTPLCPVFDDPTATAPVPPVQVTTTNEAAPPATVSPAPTTTTTTDEISSPAAPVENVTTGPTIDTTTTAPTESSPTTAVSIDTTTAVPTSDLPTTTVPTVSTTPTATTTDAPASVARAAAPAAAANLLNIEVPSTMTGPSSIVPGTTWIGTMSMTVLGVGLAGWTSEVSMSNFRGTATGRTLTPTSVTYSAPSSACTAGIAGNSAAVSVGLTSVPIRAKTGGALCLTGWTSTVSVAIPPAGVIADTYTATLTHSIY
jgi:hypothetical protein